MTDAEAEIARFPTTELEPGRFTFPPASIAKLAAVSTAPLTAVTLPGVTSLRLVTFAEAKVVLASTLRFPEVALPSCKVVAFK